MPVFDYDATGDVPGLVRRQIEALAAGCETDPWAGADRVEVWAEKAAVMGVVGPVAARWGCLRWRVPALACRGYASLTALEEAVDRIVDYDGSGATTIVYVGDRDPSGLAMDRDLRDRLGAYADIERGALTSEQIHEHQLPCQPTKTAQTRSNSR